MADEQAVIAELRRENERLRRENAMLQLQAREPATVARRDEALVRATTADSPRGAVSPRRSAEELAKQTAIVAARTHAAAVAASTKDLTSFKVPPNEPGLIELRSDTLTKPDAGMRQAMASADVGDAVWGTDPTVLQLERQVAELCGKEAALFVPSGTMGNLVCVMAHCDGRSNEVLLGDMSHQLLYEAGNLACVGGAQTRTVPTNDDGTLPIDALRRAVRGVDQHWPTTRAICLENTHNFTGGSVLPMDYVRDVRAMIDALPCKVALHCDGARVWHAATALGLPLAQVLAPFDTASLCLSKGMGAPVGSVIVGSHDVIMGKAKRYAKMLGGGMRQSGILAAACIYAIDKQFARLAEDHAAAKALADALAAAGVDVKTPQTNILLWRTPVPGTSDRVAALCAEQRVMVAPIGPDQVRAIPHYGCGMDVELVARVVADAHAKVVAEAAA